MWWLWCFVTFEPVADEDTADPREDIALPEGKVGAKKLAKLQAKAEKRSNRQVSPASKSNSMTMNRKRKFYCLVKMKLYMVFFTFHGQVWI